MVVVKFDGPLLFLLSFKLCIIFFKLLIWEKSEVLCFLPNSFELFIVRKIYRRFLKVFLSFKDLNSCDFTQTSCDLKNGFLKVFRFSRKNLWFCWHLRHYHNNCCDHHYSWWSWNNEEECYYALVVQMNYIHNYRIFGIIFYKSSFFSINFIEYQRLIEFSCKNNDF